MIFLFYYLLFSAYNSNISQSTFSFQHSQLTEDLQYSCRSNHYKKDLYQNYLLSHQTKVLLILVKNLFHLLHFFLCNKVLQVHNPPIHRSVYIHTQYHLPCLRNLVLKKIFLDHVFVCLLVPSKLLL